jgi:hypothetical protein
MLDFHLFLNVLCPDRVVDLVCQTIDSSSSTFVFPDSNSVVDFTVILIYFTHTKKAIEISKDFMCRINTSKMLLN